jgi:hypothetical protein
MTESPQDENPPPEEPSRAANGNTENGEEAHATNLDEKQMSQFVTSIKNPVHQMGEHVLGALQHPNTVAVLTTVVVGPGGQQHIVSAALNPDQMAMVNSILQNATEERVDEEVCVGFHCLVQPKGEQADEAAGEEPSTESDA